MFLVTAFVLKIALKTRLCIGVYRNTKFSQGLKYVNLSFSNNDLNSNKAKELRDSKGYIRQSGVADYFPGGIDSSNTEATLISTSPAGGNYQTTTTTKCKYPTESINVEFLYTYL